MERFSGIINGRYSAIAVDIVGRGDNKTVDDRRFISKVNYLSDSIIRRRQWAAMGGRISAITGRKGIFYIVHSYRILDQYTVFNREQKITSNDNILDLKINNTWLFQ